MLRGRRPNSPATFPPAQGLPADHQPNVARMAFALARVAGAQVTGATIVGTIQDSGGPSDRADHRLGDRARGRGSEGYDLI
jgi:hypothetical protein